MYVCLGVEGRAGSSWAPHTTRDKSRAECLGVSRLRLSVGRRYSAPCACSAERVRRIVREVNHRLVPFWSCLFTRVCISACSGSARHVRAFAPMTPPCLLSSIWAPVCDTIICFLGYECVTKFWCIEDTGAPRRSWARRGGPGASWGSSRRQNGVESSSPFHAHGWER